MARGLACLPQTEAPAGKLIAEDGGGRLWRRGARSKAPASCRFRASQARRRDQTSPLQRGAFASMLRQAKDADRR
ncbi:hypothetical protein MPC4_110052 [Methylocella tundrae]|uniref:Uncharacterized protein n=1 Tax=Methylocella tundrae TaxID=227605 RepID=A0A8B6M3P9_METTU|nr:hypothetical protein MPC4_110052 [Methylocella tundrae]